MTLEEITGSPYVTYYILPHSQRRDIYFKFYVPYVYVTTL